jgi:hypothetical protein
MEFKIGDRVRIKEGTRFYNDGELSNPMCEGTVYSISDSLDLDLNIRIFWDNRLYNVYTAKDLELVSNTPINTKMPEETTCSHPNKYINGFTTKFWVCPDCKKDLGDVK